MWARRAFGLRVTVVSFAFTGAAMFSLSLVQQALHEGSGARERMFGVPLPAVVSHVDGPGASLALFSVALLTWAALLSLSQLVVARQVRDYIRQSPVAVTDPRRFMSERMLIEAYLGLLAGSARALALTGVLAYVLPPGARPGLIVAVAAAGMVALRRFGHAVTLQQKWQSASREWRRSPSPQSTDGMTDAMFVRDAYLHRLPLRQLGILLAVIVAAVVAPAFALGASAGGASLLIMLVWIQATLGAVAGAGAFGWRWGSQLAVGPAGQRDADLDLLD